MKSIKKMLAVSVISGASAAALINAPELVRFGGVAHAQDTAAPAQGKVQAPVEASPEEKAHLEGLASIFRKVGKAVEPAVVNITVRKTAAAMERPRGYDEMLRRFFPDRDGDGKPDLPEGFNEGDGGLNVPEEDAPEFFSQGTGSGVIMEVSGSDVYIVTNNHVAGNATDMLITLYDGRRIEGGTVVGTDAKTDLAVVKIKADNVVAAPWGDSDNLEKGDWIMAFGSPFGYVGSMTHGIVSALNRQARILGPEGYESFIQVDAPINPGNSGGPLVNTKGQVVGINTAIASRTGGFQGIGFAIPSNQAKFVFSELRGSGKVVRGWLGVKIQDASWDPDLVKDLGYNGRDGVLVQETYSGTPAHGVLRHGDIITAVAGKPVRDTQQLRNRIAVTRPGTDLKMSVVRQGKAQDVTLKIGTQPENLQLVAGFPAGDAPPAKADENTASVNGFKLATPNDELAETYDLGKIRQGALVTEVEPRSEAMKAGLRRGDVITMVGNDPVTNAKQAADAISKRGPDKGVRLYVTNPRDGAHYVFVKPSAK